jgi:hypothetical protein
MVCSQLRFKVLEETFEGKERSAARVASRFARVTRCLFAGFDLFAGVATGVAVDCRQLRFEVRKETSEGTERSAAGVASIASRFTRVASRFARFNLLAGLFTSGFTRGATTADDEKPTEETGFRCRSSSKDGDRSQHRQNHAFHSNSPKKMVCRGVDIQGH